MSAFVEWNQISGLIVLEAEQAKSYLPNTLAARRRILGALKPTQSHQIQAIVQIACKYKVRLYTISTGRNWGYGSALPVQDDCVILDLGLLNRILQVDPQLGTVTLEPGVTQQQLHEFLSARNLPFLVPTTGAGPTCSVLANALERGYGITPHVDHFGAILGVKAVLPNGSLYQSALADMGGHRVDAIFKWKMGPYLDGLFAQGNFGIVTQATISLARKSDVVMQFIAFINDEHFEDAVIALRTLKQKLGSLLGGVNLMNKRRLLAMVEADEVWKLDEVLSEMQVRELAKKRKLPDWAMLGGIYAPKELVSGIQEIIRQELRPFSQKVLFLGRKHLNVMEKVLQVFPIPALSRTVGGMSNALNILEGVPNRVALRLAYLKNPVKPKDNIEIALDQDGCGLIWFSPLLPMDAPLVRDFAQEVTRVCIAQGIEPLITFTGITDGCFDATIPLVYDLRSEKEQAKARRCYDALIELSREFGVFPYRMDVESMRKYVHAANGVSYQLAETLKKAVDPDGILSPGRYSSL